MTNIFQFRFIHGLIRYTFYLGALFIFYTLFAMWQLGRFSDALERDMVKESLIGESFEVIAIRKGWRIDKLQFITNRIVAADGSVQSFDPVGVLTLYSDNIIINAIGWYPFGGCKLLLSPDHRIIGFKEYMK